MSMLDTLNTARRWVVKIGSSQICTADKGGLDRPFLQAVARDVATLRARGAQVLLVSSGAVAAGRDRLGLTDPHASLSLDRKQACAAAGQAALMHAWEEALAGEGILAAQALLTRDDAVNRRRWLNARATLERLLEYGACPVVNENDTVVTAELRYGDNDRLASHVAQMIGADVLVLLSDVDGLYTADPRQASTARHIPFVAHIDADIDAMAGDAGSSVGTGGMRSKIEAARIAAAAGCAVAVACGDNRKPILQVFASAEDPNDPSAPRMTWFRPEMTPEAARKQWIRTHLAPGGSLQVDPGAVEALRNGKSLLPAGVTQVSGDFGKGEAVRVLDPQGREIARGLVTYSGEDARRILGLRSDALAGVLGFDGPSVLIHRNDLVLAEAATAAPSREDAP